MQFKRLFMRRIFGIGDTPLEYLFPQSNGIIQIKAKNLDTGGSNGGGKSTMLEGIFYALTGRTIRKAKKMEDYLHDFCDGDGEVELEYDNIKIVRRIQPAGKKAGYELWVDGINQTINSSKPETKKLIDKYVGLNYETLSNIIVFGQHNMFSFLDAEEADKREIVENLMNLKEYNVYEEKAREIHKLTKNALKSLEDKHKLTDDSLTVQQNLYAEQQAKLLKHKAAVQFEIDNIEKAIKALPDVSLVKAQWEKYDKDIAEKKALEDALSKKKDDKNQISEKLNMVLHDMRNDQMHRSPLHDKVHAVVGKFNKLDSMKTQQIAALHPHEIVIIEQKELLRQLTIKTEDETRALKPERDWDSWLQKLNSELVSLQKQLQSVKSAKISDKEVCPTCYGKIDINNAKGVISKLEMDIDMKTMEIGVGEGLRKKDTIRLDGCRAQINAKEAIQKEAHTAKIKEAQETYDNTMKQINEQFDTAHAKLTELKKEAEKAIVDFDHNLQQKYEEPVKALEGRRARLTEEITQLSTQINLLAEIVKPKVSMEEVGKIQAQLDGYNAQKAEKIKSLSVNPFAEIITRLEEIIKDIKDKLKAIELEITENEDKLPYYEWWAEAMGKEGIKSFIIDKIVPTLNQQIEYWMQGLYQGAIKLTFDKFLDVKMVNNASGNEMMFGLGSGGEQKRVDMAIMLAFRDIMKMSSGKNPNVLFFDEVAESLDDLGVHHLFETIKMTAQDSRVYVITHHPTLNGLLEEYEKLNFQKKQGVVTLVN